MSVYTPAITSSSTMPAPSGNRSNLFVGNTLAISKKRNNRKHQSKAVNRGGARKLATRKPTISSMTMNCGSFCFRILAPLGRQPYRAETSIATTIATASGKSRTAMRLSASENGMATRVPMVPGNRGKISLLPRRLQKTVRLFGKMYSSRGAPEKQGKRLSPSRKQTTLTITTG